MSNMNFDPRLVAHDRAEVANKDEEFRNAIGHEHQVGEALKVRRESGYKVRWRIAWGQVLGWLILAAALGGFLILVLSRSGH